MKHRLIVIGVCAALLLAVFWVRDFDAASAPKDEILAYQVSPDQGVEVTLHGGVKQISVTAWLLVPLDTPADEALPYGLDLRLSDADGNVRMSRRYENFTRLPAREPDSLAYEASVMDAPGYVSEPRTVEVDVNPLGASAGRLRVRASQGKYNQVLLRLAHRVERSEFEKQLLARTMSAAERDQLTAQRSSLGFFDIPDGVRADALGFWQQRLTAAGREGRDYTVRRLLIGPSAAQQLDPGWGGRDFRTSRHERLAINVRGPLTLRVRSSHTTQVHLEVVGLDAPSAHAVPAGRWIDLSLGHQGSSTVVLFADPPSQLSLSASVGDGQQFISSEPPRHSGKRLEITPDVSHQPVYRLRETEPVTLGVAPGQSRAGLSVRSVAPQPEVALQRSVRVVWQDAKQVELSRAELRVSLEHSAFEQIDGMPVTERQLAHLHVPSGAARLLIFGAEDLVLTPFVQEPGVMEVRHRPPYDQPPPEGLKWLHAPLDIKDWALIRPDDEPLLRRAGRTAMLRSQIRLEPSASEDAAIAARTLESRADALQRPIFVPTTYSPQYTFPEHAWVLLSADRPEREVSVPEAGELSTLYLADGDRLGEPWAVRIDGTAVPQGTLAFRSGVRRLALAPGAVKLSTEGLGPGGLLLVQGAPKGGGVIVKRQSFYALDRGSRLDFGFQRRPRELLTLVVTLATEGGNADLELIHSIDGGRDSGRLDHFYHRTTELTGQHRLRTGAQGEALIWSEPFETQGKALPDRLGRVIVPLGDDLAAGPHRLTLQHPGKSDAAGRNRYWVRAVLVGRVLGDPKVELAPQAGLGSRAVEPGRPRAGL